MNASAKSYGKILLFGAYSILEPGNLGLVVNVDKGTTTQVEETDSGKIVFDLKNFEIKIIGEMDRHLFNLKKTPEVLKYVKNAVEYCFKYLQHKKIRIKDLKITTINDPEIHMGKSKTGFGSSATSTVSTVATVLKAHGIEDKDLVFKIARYSHYKSQNNSGSGFDISSACYGSQYFISEEISNTKFIDYIESKHSIMRENFYWPISLIPVIAFTGKSASTEKFIKAIMKFKEKNIKEYEEFIQDYNQINLKCKQAFELNNKKEIVHELERSWKYRKILGEISGVTIEAENITKILNESKLNGALISGLVGAGGGDSIIGLCESKEDKKKLCEFFERKNLIVFNDIKITKKEYEYLG